MSTGIDGSGLGRTLPLAGDLLVLEVNRRYWGNTQHLQVTWHNLAAQFGSIGVRKSASLQIPQGVSISTVQLVTAVFVHCPKLEDACQPFALAAAEVSLDTSLQPPKHYRNLQSASTVQIKYISGVCINVLAIKRLQPGKFAQLAAAATARPMAGPQTAHAAMPAAQAHEIHSLCSSSS